MNLDEIENIEINLLIEAIHKVHGCDFSNYSMASLKRRLKIILDDSDVNKYCELIPNVIYGPNFLETFIDKISVPVTELFRDPSFFQSIRDEVIPLLKTFPKIKVWHAGCATGQEVYSLAILLKEEGVLDNCQIYATDFNEKALQIAKAATYPISEIRSCTNNYNKSGGKKSFSDYYIADDNSAEIIDEIRSKVNFFKHNLLIDGTLGEMHLIICRNVLIYFNNKLQNQVVNLFKSSLVRSGVLCLGNRESLSVESYRHFINLNKKERIFKSNSQRLRDEN